MFPAIEDLWLCGCGGGGDQVDEKRIMIGSDCGVLCGT